MIFAIDQSAWDPNINFLYAATCPNNIFFSFSTTYLNKFVRRRGTVDDRVGCVSRQDRAESIGPSCHSDEHKRAMRVFILLHDAESLLCRLVSGGDAEIHV